MLPVLEGTVVFLYVAFSRVNRHSLCLKRVGFLKADTLQMPLGQGHIPMHVVVAAAITHCGLPLLTVSLTITLASWQSPSPHSLLLF